MTSFLFFSIHINKSCECALKQLLKNHLLTELFLKLLKMSFHFLILAFSIPSFIHGGRWDPVKCSSEYFSQKWTATKEVPDKLSQIPPQPLYMMYNRKTVFPNDTITTDDMLARPNMKWRVEKGSLYTIIMVDFGIERLGGKQYFHWLVANVPNIYNIYTADEVSSCY